MPAYEWPAETAIEAFIHNAEAWRHANHWQTPAEIALAVAAAPANLGGVVPAGQTRRIREITIRHTGSNNTVISVNIGVFARITIDVPAQTTRVWSSEDGIEFYGGEQPTIQTSDVTGGGAQVSARGDEA